MEHMNTNEYLIFPRRSSSYLLFLGAYHNIFHSSWEAVILVLQLSYHGKLGVDQLIRFLKMESMYQSLSIRLDMRTRNFNYLFLWDRLAPGCPVLGPRLDIAPYAPCLLHAARLTCSGFVPLKWLACPHATRPHVGPCRPNINNIEKRRYRGKVIKD